MAKLGDWVIEFAVGNVKAVQAAVDDVKARLTALGEDAKLAGKVMAEGLRLQKAAAAESADAYKALGETAQKVADAVHTAFKVATVTVGGFVTAGLAASAAGQVISFQLEQLSRAVAGLFGPEIQKLTELISQLVGWLNSLSEEQRAHIAHLIEGAAAAFLVGKAFKLLVSVGHAVAGAIKAITTAVKAGLTATGIGALLPLIGALIEAFTFLIVGSGGLQESFGELAEAFQPVIDAVKEVWGVIKEAFGELFNSVKDMLKAIAPLLSGLISWFLKLAKVILEVLLAPLRALAWLLDKIARGVAAVTGVDLDKKGPAKKGGRGPLAPRLGGFEDVGEAFKRLNVASAMATAGAPTQKTPVEEINDKMDLVLDGLNEQKRATEKIKWPVR